MVGSGQTTEMVPSISTDGLTKSFGDTTALDGVSFEIDGPGIVGVIGPNGAGKTTLLETLSCQQSPNGGSARVLGYSVADDSYRVRKHLTLLPQGIKGHFFTFTPREYVYHYHRIRGKSRAKARAATEEALAEFDVDYADKKMDELSGGMVKKTMLAMTLSFDTPVYLLDEPTTSLDPSTKRALWDRFRTIAEDSIILMTSHHTDEISDVCDEVVLIDEGEMVLRGETDTIATQYLPNHREKLVIEAARAPSLPGVSTVDRGRFRHVYPADGDEFETVNETLSADGLQYEVSDVTVEDLFLAGWADDDYRGGTDDD